MEEKHIPTTRHRELSLMFLKMGKSLVDEGIENKDYVTASLGNAMIFMSSTAFDKEEVKQFSELCMYYFFGYLVRYIFFCSSGNLSIASKLLMP